MESSPGDLNEEFFEHAIDLIKFLIYKNTFNIKYFIKSAVLFEIIKFFILEIELTF